MKKYFVFLGIAALTLAACTKSEIDETAVPDQKIGFNVASFTTQTRAGETETALQKEEGLYTSESAAYFKTIAKFFPAIGDPQIYMNKVDVLWKSDIHEWSPARDYYWPKTGYINFYSYVSSRTEVEPEITIDGNNATATYTNNTIEGTDNILLADAALNQTSNTQGTYQAVSTVPEGVPTLFHHLLAKVKFTVKLVTADTKKAANTKFVVTILNDTDANKKTNLVAPNTGSYSVTNTYDADSKTKAWSELKVWTPKTDATPEPVSPASEVKLTLQKNSTSSGDPVDLIAERTVLPHTLATSTSDTPAATDLFTISYKIEVFYDGTDASEVDKNTPYLTEILHFSKPLTEFAPTISAWEINSKYTYNITIDPVGNKIKFDPAVEKWADEKTASYAFPESN